MSKKFGAKSKIEDGEMMIMILFRFIKIELRSSKNPDDPILHFFFKILQGLKKDLILDVFF